MDPFGRHIDYFRISVTDRCNERCLYCMPEGYKGWAQREDHLTADEIVRIAETSTGLGFRKFRLTGGEPLVRKDCNKLRLTADGKLRPCLGRHGEIGLISALRSGGDSSAQITDALHEAIAQKPENHSFADDFQVKRPMTAIGG